MEPRTVVANTPGRCVDPRGSDRAFGLIRARLARNWRVSATWPSERVQKGGTCTNCRLPHHIWVLKLNMGLLKAYNGLLGAFVTVFGLYHVFLPYHAIELYGEFDPAPPPPAPPSPSLRHSGARLYEHRTPATGAWFITMMGIMMILVGTCLMASRAWGSEVRAIVGSVTLALFFAILGVLLIEGPESGLPRFTALQPGSRSSSSPSRCTSRRSS